jgi:corrinoid protein of di/trimethylamine methyltransferase
MEKQIGLERMAESVVKLDVEEAQHLAEEWVGSGYDPHQAIEQGLAVGIRQAGELWEAGDYFLPELIGAAEAMKAAMKVLQQAMTGADATQHTLSGVVIGTVHGDIHDIGKSLVATMLEVGGFRVTDLGNDVQVERFLEAAVEEKAQLIGMSALLTTTMPVQRTLIAALHERGMRDRFKVLVGGAPVTEAWAREIGADGYADNAAQAVRVAKALLATDMTDLKKP